MSYTTLASLVIVPDQNDALMRALSVCFSGYGGKKWSCFKAVRNLGRPNFQVCMPKAPFYSHTTGFIVSVFIFALRVSSNCAKMISNLK